MAVEWQELLVVAVPTGGLILGAVWKLKVIVDARVEALRQETKMDLEKRAKAAKEEHENLWAEIRSQGSAVNQAAVKAAAMDTSVKAMHETMRDIKRDLHEIRNLIQGGARVPESG